MNIAKPIVEIYGPKGKASAMDVKHYGLSRLEVGWRVGFETDSGFCCMVCMFNGFVRTWEGEFGHESFAVLCILRDYVVVGWACE